MDMIENRDIWRIFVCFSDYSVWFHDDCLIYNTYKGGVSFIHCTTCYIGHTLDFDYVVNTWLSMLMDMWVGDIGYRKLGLHVVPTHTTDLVVPKNYFKSTSPFGFAYEFPFINSVWTNSNVLLIDAHLNEGENVNHAYLDDVEKKSLDCHHQKGGECECINT
ncbi:hypothetical protein GmHk_16G046688 [Glycine max]|nr:hypothetical protein GmHk_16G046688 [Glycine max]